MANEQLDAAEQAFREALADALGHLKGVAGDAVTNLTTEYAPRFARLAVMDPADAKLEFDDLMVNLKADESVNAIDAQTAAAGGAMAVLRIAAKLAMSMVFPALGAIPPQA